MPAKSYGRVAPSDLYSTPHWAVRALLDYALPSERLPPGTVVLEPACGTGNIVRILDYYDMKVVASDIRKVEPILLHDEWTNWTNDFEQLEDQSIEKRTIVPATVDFLDKKLTMSNFPNRPSRITALVTNPPFGNNGGERFFMQAYRLGISIIAIYSKLVFLESERRYRLFTGFPPNEVWVFPRRISHYPEGDPRAGEYAKGGAVPYAWFIWNAHVLERNRLCFFPPSYGTPVPPSFKIERR